MIRNDIYCRYKGKEYRFANKSDGSYHIVTDDKKQVDSSFKRYKDNVYYKDIAISELDEVYSIHSYAVYNGDIFEIIHAFDNSVELITNDEKLAYENKMERSDKYEYKKVVSLSEVEVFEQKEIMEIE